MLSDVNAKHDFTEVRPEDILLKVRELPVSKWKYIGSESPHIGPMAQDFFRAFQLGDDSRHINTVDAFGIMLAAIQALAEKVDRLEKR